jgi:cephalosporin-C deacetylase-like acetyl esterase
LTASIANVPALCDHGGYLKGRNPGWPKLVLHYKKAPEYLAMSGYFDTVNFARRIAIPTVICVGFIDRTCSPSSVYAAYNAIKAPKKIINEPNMGHSSSKEFNRFANKWIKSQLGVGKPVSPSNSNLVFPKPYGTNKIGI